LRRLQVIPYFLSNISNININGIFRKQCTSAFFKIIHRFRRRDQDPTYIYIYIYMHINKHFFNKLVLFIAGQYFPWTYTVSKSWANCSRRRKEKRVWESLCESESEKWWLLVLVTVSSKKVSIRVNIHIYIHCELGTHRARWWYRSTEIHLLHADVDIRRCRGIPLFLFLKCLWQQTIKSSIKKQIAGSYTRLQQPLVSLF